MTNVLIDRIIYLLERIDYIQCPANDESIKEILGLLNTLNRQSEKRSEWFVPGYINLEQ